MARDSPSKGDVESGLSGAALAESPGSAVQIPDLKAIGGLILDNCPL